LDRLYIESPDSSNEDLKKSIETRNNVIMTLASINSTKSQAKKVIVERLKEHGYDLEKYL
jgi:hypothetical protein